MLGLRRVHESGMKDPSTLQNKETPLEAEKKMVGSFKVTKKRQ